MKEKESKWIVTSTYLYMYEDDHFDEISTFTGTTKQHYEYVNELYKKGAIAVVSELTN